MSAMQNIENIVKDVKHYLSSHHMLAYESWISGCVEYFIEEGYSLRKINETAYQQWLLNDLRYICPGSLPENTSKLDKTELNYEFILQINSVLDISVPAYQQYLKIKKTDTENIKATMNPEEKISSKRMLKFELTDGKQTIAGMEYETMKTLKIENIVPGSKIKIKGPMWCRQGMLLLTDSNVEFLGGEVQDMLETHSLGAQIAFKLNLPVIEIVPDESTDILHATNGISTDETSTPAQSNVGNREYPRSSETIAHSNPRRPVANQPKETSLPDSCASGKRHPEMTTSREKKIKLSTSPDRGTKLEPVIDDMDLEMFEEDDLKAIEECEQLYSSMSPLPISTEPFVYLKQINELSDSEKSGKVYKVKAQIQNVLSKLKMTATREWNLKCTIIDGTGCLDVEFSSDILSKLLGYTPENISDLKKRVATNPEIKNDINLAYVKTAETLRTLYCIMELTMHTLPKITKLIEFEHSHTDLLKRRLNNKDIILKLSLK